MGASATDALEVVRAEIGDPHEWGHGERLVETELRYADESPITVHIRRRGRRYEIDDEGAAVRKARAFGVEEWETIASEVVEAHDLTVNRRGVISMPAVAEADLAWLAFKVARCAYAAHYELLDSAG
jgi:hypothetical protein